MCLVNEPNLEGNCLIFTCELYHKIIYIPSLDAKERFSQLLSIHIYSVQKAHLKVIVTCVI